MLARPEKSALCRAREPLELRHIGEAQPPFGGGDEALALEFKQRPGQLGDVEVELFGDNAGREVIADHVAVAALGAVDRGKCRQQRREPPHGCAAAGCEGAYA